MAGWDFFVQFPLDKNFSGPTDRRPPAISAFFQVKTSKKLIESVCIRLSNAERMAREPKPTFFAFGLDRGDNEAIKFEVAHIGEAAISHVLATLRKNDTLPFRRRKKTVCFSRSILEIDTVDTKDNLRSAIINRSLGNIENYIRTKIQTANAAGYDKNSFASSFSVRGSDANDKLVSLMIGEIDELEVQDFSITETRFGIAQSLQNSVSGVLKMEPSEKEFGIVEFKSSDDTYRAEFECEVRAPQAAWISQEQFRLRFSNNIFSFVFSPTFGFSNWRCDPDTQAYFPWEKLKNLIYFMHICALGRSRVNIYIRGKKAIEANFTSSVKSNWSDDDLISTISVLDFMHSYPGLRPHLSMSGVEFVKFLNNRSILLFLLRNRTNKDSQISCTLSRKPKGNPKNTKFVFPFGFQCGGKLVSMLFLVDGSATIDGREVQMLVQRIHLDAFSAHSDKKSALASLKSSMLALGESLPEEAMIVVESSIFTKK